MRRRQGAILLALAAICGAFAAFVAVTGGIDARLAGFPVRSRSWERPAGVAVTLALIGLFSLRHRVASLGRAAIRWLPWVAVCWVVAAALVFGTYAAGGADSYGYVSQAELFATGRLTDRISLNPAFTWPDAAATLTPLGYTRGPSPDTLVPTYPPGFPLLMVPLTLISPWAVFLLVPLCAGITVWICWQLGRELEEPAAGVFAAVLLAVSPTFLYQAMQPMSDVPVTACWTGAILIARGSRPLSLVAAGLLASVAILVRPNLAPLGMLVVAASASTVGQANLSRAIVCAAAMVPGILALGAIQYVRYGSPLASGYGAFGDLFSLANVGPNLARYPRWLTETHTPFIWLWVLAPVWIVRAAPTVRRFAWVCYAFCIAVVAAYLPYLYFRPEEWFYTRFLLPAVPLMLLHGVMLALHVLRRISPRAALPTTACLAAALAAWLCMTARAVGAFDLRASEDKYPAVGSFVRDNAPSSAFILARQHSGSIRYYSGRQTVRWDVLDRGSLDRAVSALRAAGHEPFVVVDRDEEVEFRARFASTGQKTLERLEPIATIGPTAVYRIR
jgi:hypothetical protein